MRRRNKRNSWIVTVAVPADSHDKMAKWVTQRTSESLTVGLNVPYERVGDLGKICVRGTRSEVHKLVQGALRDLMFPGLSGCPKAWLVTIREWESW